jgi:hypothetical protein
MKIAQEQLEEIRRLEEMLHRPEVRQSTKAVSRTTGAIVSKLDA